MRGVGLRVLKLGAVALFATLLLSSCAGYYTVERPWSRSRHSSEFESAAVVHAGDQVRVTATSGRVVEGIFVAADESSLTVVESTDPPQLIAVEVCEIERVEVYQQSAGPLIRKVAAVAGSSLLVYAIINSRSEGLFDPDEQATAKGLGTP